MNNLFLIRHGQSLGNVEKKFYTYCDSAVALTQEGVQQAITAGTTIKHDHWFSHSQSRKYVVAFSSPLWRARQTARITLDTAGLFEIEPTLTPFLLEQNPGKANGSEEVMHPKDGEHILNVQHRVVSWFTNTVEPLLLATDVICFSHSRTIRALIGHIEGMALNQMIETRIPNGIPHHYRKIGTKSGHFEKIPLK